MENIVSEPVETYNQIALGFTNYIDTKKLSPILKWAGGKEEERFPYWSVFLLIFYFPQKISTLIRNAA